MGEQVGQHVVHGARKHLGNGVHLGAHLAQAQVVVGIAQAIAVAQRQPELLGDVAQEGGVVQIGLGLGDEGFALVELRQGQKNGSEVAERFVQAARLGRGVGLQPARLDAVEDRVGSLVRDDIERAAGEHPPGAAGGDEIAELQAALGAAVERVHDVGQAVREDAQRAAVDAAVPLPWQRHGDAGRCQHALVHGQGLAHDGKGVHGVELGRVGLGDEVAGGVWFDLLDAGHAGRDAGVARAGQHGAGQIRRAGADGAHRRVLLPHQHAGAEGVRQRLGIDGRVGVKRRLVRLLEMHIHEGSSRHDGVRFHGRAP